jgi:hypothetical protein
LSFFATNISHYLIKSSFVYRKGTVIYFNDKMLGRRESRLNALEINYLCFSVDVVSVSCSSVPSSKSPERALAVDRMPQHNGAFGRDDGHVFLTVVVNQVAHTFKHLVLGPHLENGTVVKHHRQKSSNILKNGKNLLHTHHSFGIDQQQVFLDTTLETRQHVLAWRALRFSDKEITILQAQQSVI